jgi:uncharacterized membrane protein
MEILKPAPPAAMQPLLQKHYRIDSIDLLRGLVMIIMALDHTRDFFHETAWTDDPLNLATTTPWLFFTRWITHFCAPIFVFLAGISIYLQSLRKTKKELTRFLITRGLWLIFIEVVLINFEFGFDIHFNLIALQTIWSIGVSMIVLGFAIWLPFPVVVASAAAIVLGHNLLDFYEANHKTGLPFFYHLLHQPGITPLGKDHILFVLYPFLPWVGLMLTGFCFGKFIFATDGAERKKRLLISGFSIIVLFVVLRAANVYGDNQPWSAQKNPLYTFFSFINTQKYPPSLLYMCMTIGPALLFLAIFGNRKTALGRIITVYGRVPFLYYVLHFLLIHLLAATFYMARGHSFSEGLHTHNFLTPNFVAANEGYSLPVVYGMWLFVVIVLYPVCKWFSDYKQKHKNWWLSYL